MSSEDSGNGGGAGKLGVSNKDRFEKLKESRQRYKDEADEAKQRW
jgi:hypothetical protein